MKPGLFRKICATALAGLPAMAIGAEPVVEMSGLSLKRIMDLDVTSVSKRTQKLRDVASSVYVINEDDIRRSGATRLQDVLKLAPGAFSGDVSYTITEAGLREGMSVFSHTVAWLLDGVPITNPIIGGMFFNATDFPLEDIDRIEVIKGPGGVIYGANSVSGIVSIFTKRGESALGFRTSLAGGTQGYLAPYVRYGVEAKDDLFLTLWGRIKSHDGYDRNPLFAADSLDAPIAPDGELRVVNHFRGNDDYQRALSGGVKWEYQPRDEWKWSGQVLESHVADGQYSAQLLPWPETAPADPFYQVKTDSVYPYREQMNQTIVQARLDMILDRDDSWFVQAYHWRNRYEAALGSSLRMGFDISEIEAQRNVGMGGHRLSAGANARRVQFDFSKMRETGSNFVSDPDNLAHLFGAFLQDEMDLGKRWRIIVGAKAETWTLISPVPEVSPSLRLAFKPEEDLTYWAAASRSITTPSYAQTDMEMRQTQIPPDWYLVGRQPGYQGGAPAAGKFVALVPGDEVVPVEYYTLEAGHRGSGAQSVQWDISAFYSWVKGQLGATPIDATMQTAVASKAHPSDSIVPIYAANLSDYESFGGEALMSYVPVENLRLELSYSLFFIHKAQGWDLPGDAQGRTYRMPEDYDRLTPNHIGRAKLNWDLPFGIGLFLNGILSSPFSRGEAFNYFMQKPMSQTQIHSQSIIADPSSVQFQLDFSLHKSLFRDRLFISIWGRNMLADPFVENFNQFGWASFPHQTHRTFGGCLVYQY